MISTVRTFVEAFTNRNGCNFDVLEIGSLNINGQVRDLFKGKYVGIDLTNGPGVDIQMDAMDIKKKFKGGEFDMVMCLETLEHTKDPVRVVENMRWALKPGGWMIISTPSINHPLHDYPSDYYRFTDNLYRDVFFADFEELSMEVQCYFGQNDDKPDAVMAMGKKP